MGSPLCDRGQHPGGTTWALRLVVRDGRACFSACRVRDQAGKGPSAGENATVAAGRGKTELRWVVACPELLEPPGAACLTARNGRILLTGETPALRLVLDVDTADCEVVTNAVEVGEGRYLVPWLPDLIVLVHDPEQAWLRLDLEGGAVTRYEGIGRLRGAGLAEEARRACLFFAGLFGPGRKLTIAECSLSEALALSFPGLIVIDPRLVASPLALAFYILPHEIAHQWFGCGVRFTGPGYLWLQESLPDYLALLYARERLGDKGAAVSLGRHKRVYERVFAGGDDLAIVRVSGCLRGQEYEALIAKGALAWSALASRVGEQPILDLLVALSHRGSPVTLADFSTLAEQVLGAAFREFRDTWLERPGLPEEVRLIC